MGIGRITFRGAPKRKKAPAPQFLLTDIEVEEISHVDYPANNRPWIVKSAGRENQDGVIEVVTVPSRTAAICEKLFSSLGALEGALEGRDPLSKRLDVSDRGRDMVFDYMGEISCRLDALCELLFSVPGTPLDGSLDAAIGGEIASIGQKFARLAEGFGVTEPPEEVLPEGVQRSETQKAGRAMSRARLSKLGESIVMLETLSSTLRTLFEGAGGDEDIMSAFQDAMKGEGVRKAVVTALDEGLATVITAIGESHQALSSDISNLDAHVVTSVEKAISTASTTASEVVVKAVRPPDAAPAAGSNQPAMERSPAPEPADGVDPRLHAVYDEVLESAG